MKKIYKDAEKLSWKLHYEKNKESSKSYHKQYYREHKYSLISKMKQYNEQNSEGLAHTKENCCMVTLGMQNLSSSMQENTMSGTGLAYVPTKDTATICQSQSLLPNTNMH